MTSPAAPGCLSDAALAALAAAPPGQGPADAAAHLAACPRCQRRFLARAGEVPHAPRANKAERPPLWRTAVAVVAILLAVLTAMFAISRLAGP
jgi:hypothetical protein